MPQKQGINDRKIPNYIPQKNGLKHHKKHEYNQEQQIYIWRVCKQKRLYLVRDEPFSLWTSLGLNQGPPDYESVALTN